MIKIIKHGNFRQTACPDCTCIFMFQEEDTFNLPRTISECDKYVKCPDCEKRIKVTEMFLS